MYSPGHVGIALLCFTPVATLLHLYGLKRAAQVGVVGALLTASAPDVDLFLATIPHRGITHTVAAAVAVGVLFGTTGALTRSPSLGTRLSDSVFSFAVGTLGVGTHLLGDVITPMGIQPFAPLLDVHYTLNLVAASDPTANAGFLVAGLLTYRVSTEATRVFTPSRAPTESVRALGEAETDLS